MRAASPEALEWPSEFRSAIGNYDSFYAWLRERNPELATRWRVAKLASEHALSGGVGDEFEKWRDRADRIEREIVRASDS